MRDGGECRDPYEALFSRFFKGASLASTYKPVFLAALVDVGGSDGGKEGEQIGREWIGEEEGGFIRVDLNFAAARFAKFYWDMLAGLGPRHTPRRMASPNDPDKDVNIIDIIKEEIKRMKKREAGRDMHSADSAAAEGADRDQDESPFDSIEPPTLRQLASDEMAEFRRKVIKRSIAPEPLVHLLTDMDGMYRPGDGHIMLDARAVAYMGRNAFPLKVALSHMITEYLEGVNPAMRHLATMVNLNEEYKDKIAKVEELDIKAMEYEATPPAGDIDPPGAGAVPSRRADTEPLCVISLDLTVGLAKGFKPAPEAADR